ncbi:MAG TPA: DinB family protein [Thermoguttaceae bacterium]|nr:DinB family protein [Thermoguttaceae bacterium]
MAHIETILGQICSTRKYTESLLDGLTPEEWFRMPTEGVTHIAWQVGHISLAEYYLALKRIRGKRPEDGALVSEELVALFGKGSTPQAESDVYPSPDEIRQMFDGVHRQAVEEIGNLQDAILDESTDPPHPMFSTKLGALRFCPQHEMLHAGQIGLLRRLLGNKPLR